ncbi:MAG TPA: GNAT family N-acetyltransferase [Patescibacteria group bacterium]|nr:GNAT family N-acetyltransferase [Patescibacteria group bacterium]
MSTTVRPIAGDELMPWLDAVSSGFLDRPDIAAIASEVTSHWDMTRVWAAFDGGRIAGTFRTWATRLTLPGLAQVDAAAVTGVAVLPTHRRRGILSAMATAEARAARERGEVAALLYASEYPIYQRFGYGPATTAATWTLDARSAAFHPPVTPGGSVEMFPTDDAGRDAAIAVFEAWRARQAGEIWRRPISWSVDFGGGAAFGPPWKGFFVVHRDESGSIDGYARYHVDGKWEERQPRGKLVLDELHALTDDAYAGLWRFLASIDWISRIEAERRHLGERLPWLLVNARAAMVSEVGDGMWVKLLDIPRALEARTYGRTGALVLEVMVRDGGEDDASAGRLRVALEASPDGAQARITDAGPDLTIDGASLGAAFLGGTRLRNAVLARGFDEHRAGALAEADALFATDLGPWTSTFF